MKDSKQVFFLTVIFSVILLLTIVPRAHALIYFDDTFTDGNWSIVTQTILNGGTVSANQVSAGGNPTNYRQVLDTVASGAAQSQIIGYHYNSLAVYDPVASGQINSINFYMDTIMLEGFGQGQMTGLVIGQGGNNYISPALFANQDVWTNQSLLGLSANNFRVPTNPTMHPDLSGSGGEITFGFLSANSTNSTSGYSILSGYDNWKVELIRDDVDAGQKVVPEPATMLLFASGLMGGALVRRRKKA